MVRLRDGPHQLEGWKIDGNSRDLCAGIIVKKSAAGSVVARNEIFNLERSALVVNADWMQVLGNRVTLSGITKPSPTEWTLRSTSTTSMTPSWRTTCSPIAREAFIFVATKRRTLWNREVQRLGVFPNAVDLTSSGTASQGIRLDTAIGGE
jgi:hypothetical protein